MEYMEGDQLSQTVDKIPGIKKKLNLIVVNQI